MKSLRSNMLTILVLLLIVILAILLKLKSEKDALQKNIDLTFKTAISDSMDGLAKDYSKIDSNQKIQYSYQTVINLKDALDVFHVSSYKNYEEYFLILNRLYLYLLENYNNKNEIDGKLYIFEFLGKSLVYPNDNELISDFNNYLDGKSK